MFKIMKYGLDIRIAIRGLIYCTAKTAMRNYILKLNLCDCDSFHVYQYPV